MQSDPRLNSWPDAPLTVVIGAGGMGEAVAKRLGQHARLLVSDLDQGKLDKLSTELNDTGYCVETAQCDITDEKSVQALANKVKDMGGFRTLAHVTGLSPSMADWQTIMAVNLIGPALIDKHLLPVATAGSAAIFVSSLAGHMAQPTAEETAILADPLAPDFMDKLTATLSEPSPTISYMLSKKALMQMCQRKAADWGARKARIVSISPGLIATPMGMLEFKNEPRKFDLLAQTPLQRQGNLHEIADAIEFLASDRASFISGTDLLVDGGIYASLASQRR